ncbi:MAG: CocE/NonD family hydrolase, partial [Acidobacteriota bacterium]
MIPRALALFAFAAALHAQAPVPRQTVSITMRDGIRLAADIYGVNPNTPQPVLLARTPYDKSGLQKKADRLARSGYVVVIEDCRGRYASEGAYTPYNNDKQDGFDTLEWIAAQPWSNGQTAMFGGSHLGLVQWLAASTLPPGLTAIAPAFTASSQYGVAYRDGVLRLALISTGGTRASPPPAPRTLPSDIGHLIYHLPLMHLPLTGLASAYGWPMPWMTSLLQHPLPGGFWDQTDGEAAIPTLPYPTQLITGYYDFFFVIFGLPLLLLMGIGPLIAWRRASLRSLGLTFAWPAGVAAVTGLVLLALGAGSSTPGLIAYSFSAFVLA